MLVVAAGLRASEPPWASTRRPWGADGRCLRDLRSRAPGGAADEHDLVEQLAERVGGESEELDAQAAALGRARCCVRSSAARLRMRASLCGAFSAVSGGRPHAIGMPRVSQFSSAGKGSVDVELLDLAEMKRATESSAGNASASLERMAVTRE